MTHPMYSLIAVQVSFIQTKSHFRLFLFLLAIFCASVAMVHGQMQTFDNRTEGTYERPNGESGIAMMSLTGGNFKSPKHTEISIRMKYPDSLDTRLSSSLVIHAFELKLKKFYKMDSKAGAVKTVAGGGIFSWPTTPFVDPLGLSIRDLGFLASYKNTLNQDVYLPVYLEQDPPVSLPPKYTVVIRASYNIGEIRVSIRQTDKSKLNRLLTDTCRGPLACIQYNAEDLITLPLDLAAEVSGEYTVVIECFEPNSVKSKAPYIFTLYHAANIH